jgi:hypothetical protein
VWHRFVCAAAVQFRPRPVGQLRVLEIRRGVDERQRRIERDERVDLLFDATWLLLHVDVGARAVTDVPEVPTHDAVLNPRPVAFDLCDLLAGRRRRQRDEPLSHLVGSTEHVTDPLEQFRSQRRRRPTRCGLYLEQRPDELPLGPRRRRHQLAGFGEPALVVYHPVFDLDAPRDRRRFLGRLVRRHRATGGVAPPSVGARRQGPRDEQV